MKIDLAGKKALVTGSTSGMGHAIASGLARAGAAVTVHGRSDESVGPAVERLKKEVAGADVRGVAADLADREAIDRLIAAEPSVDILVSNAGPTENVPFFEIEEEEWERFFRIYVMAAVRLSRHHARGMVERGWGRVVFNASVVSGYQLGEMVHWGACKAALLGLSRGLAENLAGSGVTANAFLPGPTHTEESFMTRAHPEAGKSFAEIEEEIFSGPMKASLIERFIRPEEVGNLVVFLASDQASAITGAALRVDGGVIRYPL